MQIKLTCLMRLRSKLLLAVISLFVQQFIILERCKRKNGKDEATHGFSWRPDPTVAADHHGRACCSLDSKHLTDLQRILKKRKQQACKLRSSSKGGGVLIKSYESSPQEITMELIMLPEVNRCH